MNDWHTSPAGGPIRGSNPCSEYMFLDDTACNLASINLLPYRNADGTIDIAAYEHTVRLWTIVLEISVMMAQFPSKEIAKLSYEYRTLGLGYANIGGLLMTSGIPYDSRRGPRHLRRAHRDHDRRRLCDLGRDGRRARRLPATTTATPTTCCASCATTAAPPMATRTATRSSRSIRCRSSTPTCKQAELGEHAKAAWDRAIELGEEHGYRNAQATVIAPTGTIGLVMDCDTTGIEPDFALVKFKKLAGGGYFKIINRAVPEALRTLGYSEARSPRSRPMRSATATSTRRRASTPARSRPRASPTRRSPRSTPRSTRPSTSSSSSTSGRSAPTG